MSERWAAGADSFLWRRVPNAAGRLSPVLRELLIDSRYLLAWPAAAAVVPTGAFALGVLIGLVHPAGVYTGSLAVLAVLVLLGAGGATAGVWFLTGFLPADLLLRPGSWAPEVSKPGLLVADLVLVLLLVLIAASAPRLKMQLVLWWSGLRWSALSRARPLVEVLGGALVYMLLVWSWLQSVPALIRPAYTWAGGLPDTSAIQPVQQNLEALTLLAGLAAGVLSWLEWMSRRAPGSMLHLVDQAPGARRARTYPGWLRYTVRVLVGVAIAAGLVSSVPEALLLAGVLVAGMYAQQRTSRLPAWRRFMWRAPEAVRLSAVVAGTTVAGLLILPWTFELQSSLWPVLLVTAVGLLLGAIALPARPDP